MSISLTSEELYILRVMRKFQGKRLSFHEIASVCRIKFNEMEKYMGKLVLCGYVYEFKDNPVEFRPGYMYIIPPNKIEEINDILEKDFKASVVDIEDIDCLNADWDDKTFICMNCMIAYKENYGMCKKCLGDIADIDTKILDTILELNRKGYTTMFCCSGHPSRPTSYTHIVMKGKIIVESVPEDFSIEEFNRGTVYRAPMLEKRLKKRKIQTLTDEEIEKLEFFVNCDLENLRKWVRQLPENKS